MPPVLAVGLSGKEALLVTVVHGLPKQVGAVSVRLAVPAAAPVAIVRSRVEGGIVVVIVAVVAEVLHLLSQVPHIRLVITVMRVASLPLKLCLMLTPGTLPLNQVLAVLPHTPLMLPISVLPLLLDLLLPVLVSLPSALLVLRALILVARLLGVLLLLPVPVLLVLGVLLLFFFCFLSLFVVSCISARVALAAIALGHWPARSFPPITPR